MSRSELRLLDPGPRLLIELQRMLIRFLPTYSLPKRKKNSNTTYKLSVFEKFILAKLVTWGLSWKQ